MQMRPRAGEGLGSSARSEPSLPRDSTQPTRTGSEGSRKRETERVEFSFLGKWEYIYIFWGGYLEGRASVLFFRGKAGVCCEDGGGEEEKEEGRGRKIISA